MVVNGQERRLPPEGSLLAVLADLGVDTEERGIAVAVNEEVVTRKEWRTMRLSPGARIEVLRAVQGG
ncbi:MAG: sulfur carrier protein ThiS [Chloroflexi bacterium]|nr:sulfur carrier protein ThiS [Chloroflexota bacterium]